jgi:SprT-like family protein
MRKVFILVLILALFRSTSIFGSDLRTAERLQRDYADYNQAFFSNKLPKNVKVQWLDIPKDKNDLYVMGNTDFNTVDRTYRIDIDTKSNIAIATADTTLLHEMCHVKTMAWALSHNQDGHGPAFKACIVDLELQGAFTDLL